MSLSITCSHCQAKLKINKLPAAGKSIACSKCHQSFVPTSAPPPTAAFAPAVTNVANSTGMPFRTKLIAGLIAVGVIAGGLTTIMFVNKPGVGPQPSGTSSVGPEPPVARFVPPEKGWETKETLVFDANESVRYLPDSFRVSADGRRFAYAKGTKDTNYTWRIIGDKTQYETFSETAANAFAFSRDGKHYMCTGKTLVDGFTDLYYDVLVIDGKETRIDPRSKERESGISYYGASGTYYLNDDGTQSAWVSGGTPATLQINGKNTAELGKKPDQWAVLAGKKIQWATSVDGLMVDCQKVPTPGEVHEFRFTGDGNGHAFLTKQDNQWFAVINGKPQKRYDAIPGGPDGYSPNNPYALVTSADGQHYVHPAIESGKELVIHDGKRYETPVQPRVPLSLSTDGTQWACMAGVSGNNCYVFLSGKKGKEYAWVGDLSSGKPFVYFSPDGKHFAHSAGLRVMEKVIDTSSGRREEYEVERIYPIMVRDGFEQKRFAKVSHEPLFSPDGTYLAYTAVEKENGKVFMTVDGVKLGNDYSEMHQKISPSFSPNGKSLAFVAKREGDWYVVIDGKEGKPYDAIVPEATRAGFTPDGTYTYLANRGGAYYWVEEKTR